MRLNQALAVFSVSTVFNVYQGAPWSWKVMEFRKTIFQAWKWKIAKVMESHGKVMENDDNVVEFLPLH